MSTRHTSIRCGSSIESAGCARTAVRGTDAQCSCPETRPSRYRGCLPLHPAPCTQLAVRSPILGTASGAGDRDEFWNHHINRA